MRKKQKASATSARFMTTSITNQPLLSVFSLLRFWQQGGELFRVFFELFFFMCSVIDFMCQMAPQVEDFGIVF